VSAAAHGREQLAIAGEPHRLRDVCRIGTAGDEARPTVDVAVPDAPRFVVAGVARF
jgi:hypothetical protein